MEGNYVFRQAEAGEVPEIFRLILRRMAWMDEKGIRQWNVTGYDSVYPASYYAQQQQKGTLFVLVDGRTEQILCAAVLKEEDPRWESREPSLFLHNFVSRIGVSGAGEVFLRHAEDDARKRGKEYFRLDSARDNAALAAYYESQGYLPVGACEDGSYRGILRQKKLV